MNHLTSTLYLNFIAFAFLSVSYSATKIELYAASASKIHRTLSCIVDMIRNESFPSFVMSSSFSFIIRKVSSKKEKKLLDFVVRG